MIKKVLKYYIAISCICALSIVGGLYFFEWHELYIFYAKNMRPYLFTAFLTAGSLILTLKFNILFSMKRDLYDKDFYVDRHDEQKKCDPNCQSRCTPLANLGELLAACVLGCLITAAAQFVFGFVPYNVATALCLGLAIGTFALIFYTWYQVWGTLSIWFEELRKL